MQTWTSTRACYQPPSRPPTKLACSVCPHTAFYYAFPLMLTADCRHIPLWMDGHPHFPRPVFWPLPHLKRHKSCLRLICLILGYQILQLSTSQLNHNDYPIYLNFDHILGLLKEQPFLIQTETCSSLTTYFTSLPRKQICSSFPFSPKSRIITSSFAYLQAQDTISLYN